MGRASTSPFFPRSLTYQSKPTATVEARAHRLAFLSLRGAFIYPFSRQVNPNCHDGYAVADFALSYEGPNFSASRFCPSPRCSSPLRF
jgi:hypothetical protein